MAPLTAEKRKYRFWQNENIIDACAKIKVKMQNENKKKKKRQDRFSQDENTVGAGGKIQKLQKNGDWMQQGGELFLSNLWQKKEEQ